MISIYLDWNVITNLKKNDLDISKQLNEIRKEYSDDVIFPFSIAHIQDLFKGNTSSENRVLINKDLDLLNDLSKGTFLSIDPETKDIIPIKENAHNVFSRYEYIEKQDVFNPDLFDNDFKDWLKLQKIDVDWKELTTESSQDLINSSFYESANQDNLYALGSDLYGLFKNLDNDFKLFPELLKIIRKENNFPEIDLSQDIEPINKINSILQKNRHEKSFEQLITSSFPKAKDKGVAKKDIFEFMYAFMFLDSFGYCRDAISNKNTYKNFTTDSLHALHGGFCDYFVSNDKKTTHKAKILYKYFNSSTIGVLATDFIAEFERSIKIVKTPKDFADLFNEDNLEKTEENNEYYKYTLRKPILNFFNTLIIPKNENERFCFQLYRTNYTFARFSLISEIEALANKMLLLFGTDLNYQNSLTDDEIRAIFNNCWEGRLWYSKPYVFHLVQNRLNSNIELLMEAI